MAGIVGKGVLSCVGAVVNTPAALVKLHYRAQETVGPNPWPRPPCTSSMSWREAL